jgi:hypothetical protein
MAASHRISRTQGNKAYGAHSFIDFEATVVLGGATSGQVIGVDVGITDKAGVDVVASNSYEYEVLGGVAVSEPIYDAVKALAALIQTGIGPDGVVWVSLTSANTCRLNVIAKGIAAGGHFANMTTPTLVAPV